MASVPEHTTPFEVRAIANFTARSVNEMSIEAGKLYKVIQTDGKGLWWNTQGPNGNYGWFPANYVEIVQPSSGASTLAASATAAQPAQSQQGQQNSANAMSTLSNASFASTTPPTPLKFVKDKGNSPITVQLHST